jgi:UDP-GlcNAc:undecaprenyl-phosphate GlcNAc-1-phosphate transferase
MFSYAIAFLVALTTTALLIPPIRRLAADRGLLDQPGGRKVHAEPVPRLGGMAIAIGFFLAMALVVLVPFGRASFLMPEMPGILAGGAILAVVGMVDDLFGVPPLAKLVAQIFAAVVAYLLGVQLDLIRIPGGTLGLDILSLPITVAWIVGMVNAVNLIDGLDGLAAGVVLIALVAFFVIAPNDAPLTLIVGAAAGATLGFLAYNLHPASIIMGDAGSLLLGFLVAVAGVSIASPGSGFVPFYVPLVVLALPLGDTLWTIVRRSVRGASVFEADAGHVHHRLLYIGLNQREVVVLLHLVAAILAAIGIGLARLH